jgi:hypothetical protein
VSGSEQLCVGLPGACFDTLGPQCHQVVLSSHAASNCVSCWCQRDAAGAFLQALRPPRPLTCVAGSAVQLRV